MRKPLIGLLVACVAGFVLLASTAGEKCQHSESKCCEWMKDAKVDISNIENGIMIKITSDKPEVVKSIQECADKYLIECKDNVSQCFLIKTGSVECKIKAGETEKCTIDNPGSCCSKKESGECKKVCEPEKCKP